MIISIDGPSGAGKSSVADDIARRLDFARLDTGAMFRAIAYAATRDDVDYMDEETLEHIAQTQKISFTKKAGEPAYKDIYIDDECITDKIHTPKMDKAVTPVCKHAKVRQALLEQQRRITANDNYVVDGRDIGSVVFPNAELKIYLDADVEERAKRRYNQNKCSGIDGDFDEILQEVKRRDYEDSHREVAPLCVPDGAVVIDSTNMTQAQVVDKICELAKSELAHLEE